MGIGPRIRRTLGRHERRISELYRQIFIDLDAFVATVVKRVPPTTAILEVGCGDGMVTERLTSALPGVAATGIDICPAPGRLYRGDRTRARFIRVTAEDLAATEAARYPLIIVADVLHHVPIDQWPRFLRSVAALLAEGGTVVLKDWVQERTPAYLCGYLSDRFITGDRIHYASEAKLRALAQEIFGSDSIRSEFRVRPWHCNFAMVITPRPHATNKHPASRRSPEALQS